MSDPIARLNAALEGRYVIERELGEGGMATVYLADDLKHERKVALKVLKPELAAVVGAERFLTEIKTTANLTHPHILPLHDSGEADGFLFYVMPHIEGESLRERIDREKQLGVEDALAITQKVANALDYAHGNGVVHRDIKPGNILLSERGEPLIADFGIALAVGAAGGGRLTETGLSLGTPYYMSPEQATGDQFVGATTDTYALGVVLYEMLTGDPPYMGSTAQAVLGQIISSRPISAREKRPSIPANVDAALRKALEKLPADRFQSSQDFAKALSDEFFRYGELATAGAGGVAAGSWNRLTASFAALATAVSLALAWSLFRPVPPMPVERFVALSTVAGNAGTVTLSPDGTAMVYEQPDSSGQERLWLRRWGSLVPTPLPDSEGGFSAVISPDGTEAAFVTGTEMKVAALQGGIGRTLTNDARCCLRWDVEGFIYYQAQGGHIHRVGSLGGQPEVVVAHEEGGFLADFQVVPGSDLGVYNAWGPARIIARRLSTGEEKELTSGLRPFVTRSGHLIFATSDGQVLAAPLDLDAMELTAPPVPLVEDVLVGSGPYPFYWVSDSGRLVYWSVEDSEFAGGSQLIWVDRDGQEQALDVESQRYVYPRVSPGGDRLAVAVVGEADTDIWVFDLNRGSRSRITFGGDNRYFPVWTPAGDRLTFSDGVSAPNTLYLADADGSGRIDTLLQRDGLQFPTSWSSDGRLLAFYERGVATGTGRDLWVLPVGGDPEPFLITPFQERAPFFSPDGRWMAYVSDKSGRNEVYLQPYPGPGLETVLSTDGGTEPVWSPDGSELFYRSATQLMVVDLTDPVRPEAPIPLWADSYRRDPQNNAAPNYDIAADGERFIVVGATGSQGREIPLILVTNWFEELRRRVPN